MRNTKEQAAGRVVANQINNGMIFIILIQNGDDEIVKVLVEAGAVIDIQDQYLRFPLQLAAGVSTYT